MTESMIGETGKNWRQKPRKKKEKGVMKAPPEAWVGGGKREAESQTEGHHWDRERECTGALAHSARIDDLPRWMQVLEARRTRSNCHWMTLLSPRS